MRILVCVKQVMEMEGMIRIDPSGGRVCADRSTTYRMNRFDEYALEEALLIAECGTRNAECGIARESGLLQKAERLASQFQGFTVSEFQSRQSRDDSELSESRWNRDGDPDLSGRTRRSECPTFSPITIHAITVGPERSALVLRRAMGMGADHGIHLLTREDGRPTGFEIASWIAAYAKRISFDLILTGAISEDEMQGQVGPMIAALLSIPWATSVIHERIREGSGEIKEDSAMTVYVEREMEGGYRQAMELDLPALLALQTGINRPRYPSLSKMLSAKTQHLETIKVWELEGIRQREQTIRLDHPQRQRAGMILEGSSGEKARQFLEILRARALIQ